MSASAQKKVLELSALKSSFGLRPEKRREWLSSGLVELDRLIHGFPRGAISEVVGSETSGRTALAHSALAAATSCSEICAYIDVSDSFDPVSAARAGAILRQVIWVRCRGNIDHALKAVDYLLHAGGFGVIVLDLGHVPTRTCRRIPLSYWYRFRRAIENSQSVFMLLEKEAMSISCTSLLLEMKRCAPVWSGAPGFKLLRGLEFEVRSVKPLRPSPATIRAQSLTANY